jgi:hypothetical protein
MKALSLKVKETIFQDAEKVVRQLHMARNAYINEALDFYNKYNRRKLLRKQLRRESAIVRDVSLDVLKEMEALDDSIE